MINELLVCVSHVPKYDVCLRTMRKKRLAALRTLKPFKSMTCTSGDVMHGLRSPGLRLCVYPCLSHKVPTPLCPRGGERLDDKRTLTDMKVISLKISHGTVNAQQEA